MQISISDGIRPAFYFAFGVLLVEIIYVRLSLVAMDWVRRRKKLFRFLEWFSLLVIAALAVTSFIAAADPHEKKNVLLSYSFHRFWLGVVLSALFFVAVRSKENRISGWNESYCAHCFRYLTVEEATPKSSES